jgi:hypothetical protein
MAIALFLWLQDMTKRCRPGSTERGTAGYRLTSLVLENPCHLLYGLCFWRLTRASLPFGAVYGSQPQLTALGKLRSVCTKVRGSTLTSINTLAPLEFSGAILADCAPR